MSTVTNALVPPPPNDEKSRRILILLVVGLSLATIVVTSALIIWLADANNRLQTAQFVFGSILPLMASWVGTVMAFYFSKDNFQAATQSVSDLARTVSGMEKLKAISARDKMRPVNQIRLEAVTQAQEDSTRLQDLMNKFSNRERMLIVSAVDSPVVRYLIYKAMVNEFLADCSLGTIAPGKNATDLTLADLIRLSPVKAAMFKNSFDFVAVTATLADAKIAMDKIDKCNDIFVTQNGKPAEPILGWITDNTIVENSRV